MSPNVVQRVKLRGYNGLDMDHVWRIHKCIQNFGKETLWMNLRDIDCNDGRWMEVSQDHVQWQTLILAFSELWELGNSVIMSSNILSLNVLCLEIIVWLFYKGPILGLYNIHNIVKDSLIFSTGWIPWWDEALERKSFI